MRDEPPKDLLDEWIVSLLLGGSDGPKSRADADDLREHAIADLADDGVTEAQIDDVTGGDFGGYVLATLNRPVRR